MQQREKRSRTQNKEDKKNIAPVYMTKKRAFPREQCRRKRR
jgi:hypothetical protein